MSYGAKSNVFIFFKYPKVLKCFFLSSVWFISQLRLPKADIVDSFPDLSITIALFLTLLPPTYLPPSCLTIHFCKSAFRGHWCSIPPNTAAPAPWHRRLIRQEIDVRKYRDTKNSDSFEHIVSSVFVWHSEIMRLWTEISTTWKKKQCGKP